MRPERRKRPLGDSPGYGGPMLLLLLACDPARDDSKVQGQTDDSGAPPIAEGCRADPGDPNKVRALLLSFPYDEAGNQTDQWSSWSLGTDGTLRTSQSRFSMGRATAGQVVYTPDGSIALAPQADGTIGVYAEGTVVEAALGDIYAEHIVMDPSGEKAWAIDGNWPDNGGGIYPLTIACDRPTVNIGARWIAAKLPAAMLPVDENWLIVGREVAGSGRDADVVLVDTNGNWLAEADAFGDNEAFVSAAVLSRDGRYLLIGDISEFSGVPTRVAVVEVGPSSLTPVQILDVEDPVGLFVSPDDDRVVVLSGYGDALFVLERTDNDAAPYKDTGEPAYRGGRPQLPGAGALIERGTLKGLLMLTEVEGVRQVQIQGGVEDWGLVQSGGGWQDIPGAIGVVP